MHTFLLSKIEVGSHFYVYLTDTVHFHAETVLITALVVGLLSIFLIASTRGLQKVPGGLQNAGEFLYEFVEDIAFSQLGPSYYTQFFPFIMTIFLFVLGSNWIGALVPWKIIELPEGEFSAPTNDINTTACLAILVSVAYFGAGLKIKGLGYFGRYVKPSVFLLPINIIEDFTKPLSLSFRLFGNVVADELTVSVICSLVPLFIPVPIMVLGLFASSIQALIFATLAGAYIAEVIE